MASSETSPDAARRLGALLTATQAADLSVRIERGDTLTSALRVVDSAARAEIRRLMDSAGIGVADRERAVAVLRAIEGAKSVVTAVEPVWTMPAHLARGGRLQSSVVRLVKGARTSVTCSTYNFQRSSGLWSALHEAAGRPEILLRVYVDGRAATGRSTPSVAEIARHLHPAQVFQSTVFDGAHVRNHAKYVIIDHRFTLITSANFSWSAEHGNVEFGVLLDNPNLADSIEREARRAEDSLFERVRSG